MLRSASVAYVSETDDGWMERKPFSIALTHTRTGTSLAYYRVSPMPASIWQRLVTAFQLTVQHDSSRCGSGASMSLRHPCSAAEPLSSRIGCRVGFLYQHTAHFLTKGRLDTHGNADVLCGASFDRLLPHRPNHPALQHSRVPAAAQAHRNGVCRRQLPGRAPAALRRHAVARRVERAWALKLC